MRQSSSSAEHRRHHNALTVVLLLFGLPLLWAESAIAGTSNSLMDISADGALLVCTNRDSGTLTVVDLSSHRKLKEIPLGRHPEGLTFVGATHTVAAAVYDDDAVVFVDVETGERLGQTDVFDEPYGIVSNAAGTRVYVTLDYPGRVVDIDAESHRVLRSMPAGKFTRGLALSANEERLYVTEYYTTVVRALDLKTGQPVDEWPGASTDNLARQIALHPRRPKAYLPHIRSRVTAVHGEGSIFPYISVVDTAPGEGRRRTRIPMDAFRGNFVVANPWEVAVSPDGRRLYAVFSGTDDMFVCDVLDDNYREIALAPGPSPSGRGGRGEGYLKLGHNPRAVRVAPDSNTFYVYNALDFEVVAYDAESLKPVATIPVCENPLGEQVLLGKVLFYSALQPMVGRRWISCSSCHPDGEPDGRTWHNPEGLRNTQSLAGLAWTHPLHWSADRDEVQDFEHTIRGPLMQGRGLIEGDVNPELGPPNRGLSRALDALAAYTNSHAFTLSPYAKGGLSKAAQRGKRLFFSKETGCATCHTGPFYTDSTPHAVARSPDRATNRTEGLHHTTGDLRSDQVRGRETRAQRIVRHNVGTGDDDPTEKLGPAYDTPTLLGVYRTAPYLHHGKAKTLEEVLTTCNSADKHGKTSHLTRDQIADLVEFLKSLPFETPEPARAR